MNLAPFLRDGERIRALESLLDRAAKFISGLGLKRVEDQAVRDGLLREITVELEKQY